MFVCGGYAVHAQGRHPSAKWRSFIELLSARFGPNPPALHGSRVLRMTVAIVPDLERQAVAMGNLLFRL
jgi:hypothetical protein